MEARDFRQLSIEEWLEALAAADPVPGGGSAAAITAATAAALVAMTARVSDEWPEAAGIAAQALALRDRLVELAQADAKAYAESLTALAAEREQGDERRDFALGATLERAAQVPLVIAETACDVAVLAANAKEHVRLDVQPDVEAAAALAAAAAAAAARLVEVNLTTTTNDDRARQARRAAERAAATVQSGR